MPKEPEILDEKWLSREKVLIIVSTIAITMLTQSAAWWALGALSGGKISKDATPNDTAVGCAQDNLYGEKGQDYDDAEMLVAVRSCIPVPERD